MEKDYFKDRPIEVTQVGGVTVGMEVFICVKSMQSVATEIQDLSRGTVTKLLTKHSHDRGLKVEIIQENGFRMVGRTTYIVQDGLILTKYGWKEEKDVNK